MAGESGLEKLRTSQALFCAQLSEQDSPRVFTVMGDDSSVYTQI